MGGQEFATGYSTTLGGWGNLEGEVIKPEKVDT